MNDRSEKHTHGSSLLPVRICRVCRRASRPGGGGRVRVFGALLLAVCCLVLAGPAAGSTGGGDMAGAPSPSRSAGEYLPDGDAASRYFRAPEIDALETLRFYQLDTLRIWLDTLVTDEPETIEELEWEVEVLDSRFLDNPNSSSDQHLIVELDPDTRILTFTTTRFFVASDIPVRLVVEDPEGLSDDELFRIDVLPVEGVPGKVYELKQNYPNPFAGTTTIEYWVPVRARVIIGVYDLMGRLVARLADRRNVSPGIHRVEWRPSHASGPYYYRMEALGVDGSRFVQSRGMTHIR